jgi:hypothetical protein
VRHTIRAGQSEALPSIPAWDQRARRMITGTVDLVREDY